MISISVFARLTGLSAKALRHYHDRGVLVPARVDPDTGYRTYELAQVADAARISVLRRAGMPLELVRAVIDEPDRAEALVEEYRDATRRRREAEDRALDGLTRMLDEAVVLVGERRMPAQPFAAVSVPVTDPPDDRLVDRSGRELHDTLTAAGVVPTGPFWTTLAPDGDALRVLLHWPLPADAPLLADVRSGALPARTEVFIEIPLPERNGDESVELALAALLATDPDRRPDPRTLRQTVFTDTARVEFAIVLGTSA